MGKEDTTTHNLMHEVMMWSTVLDSVWKNNSIIKNRNPEFVREIISTVQKELAMLKSLVDPNSPYRSEKIRFIERAERLPSFEYKGDITRENMPPLSGFCTDNLLLEKLIGDVLYSLSILNSIKNGFYAERPARRFEEDLNEVIRLYEISLVNSKNKKGEYRKDPVGRAIFAYAYEFLANPERDKIISAIRDGNYDILYSAKGANLNVWSSRYVNNRSRLYKIVSEHISTGTPICYPHIIRSQVIEFIPEYRPGMEYV
jgi:hypothetical protein